MCLQFRRCALFAKEMSKRRLKGGFFVYFLALSLLLSHRLPLCFPSYFGWLLGWLSMATMLEWEFVYTVQIVVSRRLCICISLFQLDNGKQRTYNQNRNETKCDGWSTFWNPTIYTIHIVLALPPSYCLPATVAISRKDSFRTVSQTEKRRLHRKILKSGLLYSEKLWEKIRPFKELRS